MTYINGIDGTERIEPNARYVSLPRIVDPIGGSQRGDEHAKGFNEEHRGNIYNVGPKPTGMSYEEREGSSVADKLRQLPGLYDSKGLLNIYERGGLLDLAA